MQAILCMYPCVNYEVERQRHNNTQVNYTQDSRAALGGIRTQSRRVLYQLSYQGNSAGRGSNHNTRQTSNHCAMAQYTLPHSNIAVSANKTVAMMAVLLLTVLVRGNYFGAMGFFNIIYVYDNMSFVGWKFVCARQ